MYYHVVLCVIISMSLEYNEYTQLINKVFIKPKNKIYLILDKN